MKLPNATKILSILLCVGISEAIRGSKYARATNDGRLPEQNSRRQNELKVFESGAAQKTGKTIQRQGDFEKEPVVESYDDPEEYIANSGVANKGNGKESRQGGIETDAAITGYDSEDMNDPEPANYGDSEDVAQGLPDGGPAKKGSSKQNGGSKQGDLSRQGDDEDSVSDGYSSGAGTSKGEDSKGGVNEPTYDSEDIYVDPDDTDPAQTPPNNRLAGFPPLEENSSSTMVREIPLVHVRFSLPTRSTPEVEDGDYNELAVVTAAYLNEWFTNYFFTSPAHHAFTQVRLHKNLDPLTVSFQVGANFYIPGEVPTLPSMLERVQESFKEDEAVRFLSELGEMSSTNPFRYTVSFEVIRQLPDSATGNRPTSNNPSNPVSVEKKKVIFPLLAGVGFLILVTIGFLWVRKRRVGVDDVRQLSLDQGDHSKDTNDEESGFTTADYKAQVHGPDDETLRYLNTIREKYKYAKEEDASQSKTSVLEDISLGDDNVSEEASIAPSLIEDDCSHISSMSVYTNGEERAASLLGTCENVENSDDGEEEDLDGVLETQEENVEGENMPSDDESEEPIEEEDLDGVLETQEEKADRENMPSDDELKEPIVKESEAEIEGAGVATKNVKLLIQEFNYLTSGTDFDGDSDEDLLS